MKAVITKFYADIPAGTKGEVVKSWTVGKDTWYRLYLGTNLSGKKLYKHFHHSVIKIFMTKQDVEIGAKYLAEIDALQKVAKICTAYGWQKHCDNENIVNNLSVLGTDFGKPNATLLMTELAKGNREMFMQVEKIINKRIDVLKEEFKAL